MPEYGQICLTCTPNPTEEQLDYAIVPCFTHRPKAEGIEDLAADLKLGTKLTNGEADGTTGRLYAEFINGR